VCHKAAPESEQKDIKAQVYPPTSVPRCPHCMGEGFAWDRVPEACSNIGFLDGHCTAESFARFGDRCTAGVWVPGGTVPQSLAPNGWSLHRRDPWVPGGTVPQSLMHRMVGRCTAGAFGFLEALFHRAFSQGNIAVAPQGQIIMAKRMRIGDPPLT